MIKKYRTHIILSSIVILLPVLAGLILWNRLPDAMTTHWGADGNADGWSGKGFAVFGLPLILSQGWPVLLIGIPSLFFAYGYTGGPWPLAYHGLGELFVLLFFGLVAVVGTVFVQIGWQPGYFEIYCTAVVLGVQCGLLSCLLIEVNNIRDRKEDATTGKRTLAVRWGERRARGLAMAFLVAPYVTLKQTSFFLPGFSWNLVWLAAILVGGYILLKLNTMPADRRMNMLLGLSSLHMGLFLLALTL
jgi:1,4-dihydroxy-2-naphthoate octaprenyltransferase